MDKLLEKKRTPDKCIKRHKILTTYQNSDIKDAFIYPINMCFSGCGFLISYYFGVVSCFKENAENLLANVDRCMVSNSRFYGSSAGSLVCVYFLSGYSIERVFDVSFKLLFYVTSKRLGLLDPSLRLEEFLRKLLKDELPESIHELCNGRLFINLTHFGTFRPKLVSEFESKKDLIDALICSCFVPYIFGLIPPKFRGERFYDGGWSDNLPRHSIRYENLTPLKKELLLRKNNAYVEELHGVRSSGDRLENIIITPFSGEGDISPREMGTQSSIRVTVLNTIFSLHFKNLIRLFRGFIYPSLDDFIFRAIDGYFDAYKFLIGRNCVKIHNKSSEKPEEIVKNRNTIIFKPFFGLIDDILLNVDTKDLKGQTYRSEKGVINSATSMISLTIFWILKFWMSLLHFICCRIVRLFIPLAFFILTSWIYILALFLRSNRSQQVLNIWRNAIHELRNL